MMAFRLLVSVRVGISAGIPLLVLGLRRRASGSTGTGLTAHASLRVIIERLQGSGKTGRGRMSHARGAETFEFVPHLDNVDL